MEDPRGSAGLFSRDGLSEEAERKLASISSLLGALTFALGLAAVVGWKLDIPSMREVVPGGGPMRPLVALYIGLLGASLFAGPARPSLGRSLALLSTLVATVSIFPILGPVEAALREFVVDARLLAAGPAAVLERATAMGALPAFGFLCLAVALVTGRNNRLVIVAQTLTVTVMFVAVVPLARVVYQVDAPTPSLLPEAPSLISALATIALTIGILATNPRRGVVAVLASNTSGSRTARQVLPYTMALPFAGGLIFLYARRAGVLDLDTVVPVFVCTLAATLSGAVLWAARATARIEILSRRDEANLRDTVDTSPMMMWMADTDAIHLNPPSLAFLGLAAEEIDVGGWQIFTHPDDIERCETEIVEASRQRRTYSAEFRVRRADGEWRWVLSNGIPRLKSDRRLAGFTGTWVDVTSRKAAEAALQSFAAELEARVAERTQALSRSREELARQAALLESIVRSMGDAVLAVSTDGRVLLTNDAAGRLLGTSGRPGADGEPGPANLREGFYLTDGVTPFPPDQLPMLRAMQGVNTDNVVMIVRHREAPEGTWVRITGRPIRDPDGELIGAILVGRDVTEFETALETTRRLASVVESSGDAILSVTLDGRISSWNRGAEQMYGYRPEEALGVPLGRLDTSFDLESIPAMLERFATGTDVVRRESKGRRRDGSPVDITVSISPIEGASGSIEALAVVHHDVSHLKQAERRIQTLNTELAARIREIEHLNDELELRVKDRTAALLAANHDLENYASSVAHDLRTPLRAIAGFARVLEEDYGERVDEEGRRLIGVVRKNAQDMGAFIDALLSFSAVDRQPPDKEQVDVAQVVRECLDSLDSDLGDRKVAFAVGDLPPCRADRASLKQIFLNLLSNAIKFTRNTEQARIEIGSHEQPDGTTAYHVTDNGVGFDMSNTRRLFGIFQRLHSPAEFEGTGLGLANVARIVAAHGGKVWAEAETGRGATFFFVIEPSEGGP